MRRGYCFSNALIRKRVSFSFIEAALDNLAEIKGLGVPSMCGEKIKPLFGFRRKSNRGCHVMPPLDYLYA
ncbi:MAG: hypothetical protein A2505_10280 [Deltaproteobacteria bacterium RIFOXYD12_FULL_55_16]|nr:MAG: hypothetical protein A2505_10280 [Deltaproteobacteria bacterium RIFOXYD12_FULL_55_16]